MFNISIQVIDSIASDMATKVLVCNELHISNMELVDGQEGASIAQMNGAQLEAYRHLLIDHNIKIVLLSGGRPASDYDYYNRLFHKAYNLNVESIKVLVSEPDNDEGRSALIKSLKTLLPLAQSTGIKLVIENQADSLLSNDHKLTEAYKTIKTEQTGIIFNPLEFVRMKAHPFFHAFYASKLKDDICFLRVQDGYFQDGSAVMLGQGNAELKELLSILLHRSFKGYFSFTPYLEGTDVATYSQMIEQFREKLKEL